MTCIRRSRSVAGRRRNERLSAGAVRWRRVFPTGCERGFSLLEALVALTLLAVIMAGLTMMFNQAKRTLRRGGTQVDILDGARATMNLLALTLQEATPCQIPGVTNVNFAVGFKDTPPPPQFLTNGNILNDLFVLCRDEDEWRAVRFAFNTNEAAGGVATLYMRTVSGGPYDAVWLSDAFGTNVLEQVLPEAHVLFPLQGFRRVVEGVVLLRAIPYDTNGVELTPYHFITTNIPPPVTFSDRIVGGQQVFFAQFHDDYLPAFVDLELGLLEAEALAQYRNVAGVNPTVAEDMLATNWVSKVHLFRQRVPIRVQPRMVP